jgi:hypothetical protein
MGKGVRANESRKMAVAKEGEEGNERQKESGAYGSPRGVDDRHAGGVRILHCEYLFTFRCVVDNFLLSTFFLIWLWLYPATPALSAL